MSNKFEGKTFACAGCGGTFYELTDKFSEVPPMRGDYIKLIKKYGPEGHNWYDFPHTEFTVGDNVACVQCGEPVRTSHIMRQIGARVFIEGVNWQTLEEKAQDGDGSGMYDSPDVQDRLQARVLEMTAKGYTQSVIAETCEISIYRVRKLQSGDLD